MHELAIAQSILHHTETAVPPQDLGNVRKILVRIGRLTDVVPDALMFNFDIIKTETRLENATLEIEEQAVMAHCTSCGRDFVVESFLFACPDCASGQVKVTAGQELDIVYVELEDEIVNGKTLETGSEGEDGQKTNTA